MSDQNANSVCPMCGRSILLVGSHIIPKSIWREIKRHGSGKIRYSNSPNERMQDGPKLPLLCRECDNKLGIYENYFVYRIYRQLYTNKVRIDYNTNLKRFFAAQFYKVILSDKHEWSEEVKNHTAPLENLLHGYLVGGDTTSVEFSFLALGNCMNAGHFPKEMPERAIQSVLSEVSRNLTHIYEDLFSWIMFPRVLMTMDVSGTLNLPGNKVSEIGTIDLLNQAFGDMLVFYNIASISTEFPRMSANQERIVADHRLSLIKDGKFEHTNVAHAERIVRQFRLRPDVKR